MTSRKIQKLLLVVFKITGKIGGYSLGFGFIYDSDKESKLWK